MPTKYLYAVRLFKNKKWHVMRFYSNCKDAEAFALHLNEFEWDIKKMTYNEANCDAYAKKAVA